MCIRDRLGFVLELLVVEEKLFARGEDEIGAAVNTFQNLVLEFHGELLPSARGPRAMDEEKRNFQEDRAERPCCQSQLPVLSYNSLGFGPPCAPAQGHFL